MGIVLGRSTRGMRLQSAWWSSAVAVVATG